jgi:predicted MFS family arabinose efflux permease
VVHGGYSAAFLALGAIAAVAVLVCWLLLPETSRQTERPHAPERPATPSPAIATE